MRCIFKKRNLSVTFESEADPQLFLACSSFLGKFEPHCSYKIVLMKKACMFKNVLHMSLGSSKYFRTFSLSPKMRHFHKKNPVYFKCKILFLRNSNNSLQLNSEHYIIIIIITLLTCQVCLAEGKPSTNRGHLIDN